MLFKPFFTGLCLLFLGWPLTANASVDARLIYLTKPSEANSLPSCSPNSSRDFSLFEGGRISKPPTLAFANQYNSNSFFLLFASRDANGVEPFNSLNTITPGFNEVGDDDAFILDSTLLSGPAALKVAPTSFVLISHIDSDPLKKSLYPPLFDRLQEKMKSFEGFVDMQVWTWNQRDNHWTLIQVWDSPSTYNHAVQTHGYQSVWRQLLRFTASPTDNSPYCLLNIK